jgi:molybdenum cofactor cytidylyltransferase
VLAAGESTRFPWNKMLYRYSGKPLVVQAVENALDSGFVDEVVVVTGYQHELVEEALEEANLRVHVVYNEEYRTGMSSSVRKGVEYALAHFKDLAGIMVNPGDAAWVHPGVYALLAVKFSDYSDRYDVFVASYRGRRGHPVLFSQRVFSDLLSITEEKRGLKEVTEKYKHKTMLVETEYPGVLLDLDTVLDLNRVKATVFK